MNAIAFGLDRETLYKLRPSEIKVRDATNEDSGCLIPDTALSFLLPYPKNSTVMQANESGLTEIISYLSLAAVIGCR